MTAVRIRRRKLTHKCGSCGSSTHYLVIYRLGGRGFPELTGGTFHRLKDAETRRDVISGEIAAMRDPRRLLREMRTPAAPARTYRQWADAYLASRIDYTPNRLRGARNAIAALDPIFGDLEPAGFTVPQQIEAIARLARGRAPLTVRGYWNIHRLILDFAAVDPNPARDKAVRLPKVVEHEPVPPSAEHFLAILDGVPRSRRLPLVVLEQTGMAPNELAQLEWGDVDEQGCRFRLRRATVKGNRAARARMVQLPGWLMRMVAATCPREDRTPTRRVFPGQTQGTLYTAMSRACRDAGIPVYGPYDLRHRRISLWHEQGVPAREITSRAGHTRTSTHLDVYSHILVDTTEIPAETFMAVIR